MSFSKLFKIFIIPLIIFTIPMVWYLNQSKKITWTDSQDQERVFFIPKLPGVKLVSEKQEQCYWRGEYQYKATNEETIGKIKSTIKTYFLQNRWSQRKETESDGTYELEFYNPESTDLQIISALIEPEKTSILFQWPPCSEEY